MNIFAFNEEMGRLICILLALVPWKTLILKDEQCRIISERGLIFLLIISGVHLCWIPIFWKSVGILTGGAIFFHRILPLWWKKPFLGEGDVKLFSLCGLWIDIEQLPIFLIVVGATGILRCLIARKRCIPFAFPLFWGWLFCACKMWWQQCGDLYML
ncbi:MAG: prepilin peptidase [Holosporales bacterium]|jgi:Flp pilus assembly protein protease CpaA|nr:prepilin peptidase [Holosporales bacterium]